MIEAQLHDILVDFVVAAINSWKLNNEGALDYAFA
jgi:hypothetical protein